jgi:hypothetical protein
MIFGIWWVHLALGAFMVACPIVSFTCIGLEFMSWREKVKQEERAMRYGYGPLHRN